MKKAKPTGTTKKAIVMSERGEQILRMVHFYRFVTALDVAHYIYSPSYLSYVRARLSELCGGGDYVNGQYLYRFCLPSVSSGAGKRVYTLGSRGRDYALRELDLPADWYFRPHKMTSIGYSQMVHNLILTRFLVAAHLWSERQTQYQLRQVRICYELAKAVVQAPQLGQKKGVIVIPDAWLNFEEIEAQRSYPIMLEIDRGTQFQRKFKEYLKARLEFVGGGAYKNLFGTKAVVIAYATAGGTTAQRETRLRTIRAWTNDLLNEMRMQSWASVFRFRALSWDDEYDLSCFERRVWHLPDRSEPHGLFPST